MKDFILNNNKWIQNYLVACCPMDIEFIHFFEDKLNWDLLCKNGKINFTLEFCLLFSDHIDWESFNPFWSSCFEGDGRDKRLNEFLDRFQDKINWSIVSEMPVVLENSDAFLWRYKEKLDWELISLNFDIEWNLPMLRRFSNLINWSILSSNFVVDWKFDWLVEFEDRIDWLKLYEVANFNWDYSSVMRFRHKLNEIENATGIVIDSFELARETHDDNEDIVPVDEGNEFFINSFKEYNSDDLQQIINENDLDIRHINFQWLILWNIDTLSFALKSQDFDISHLSSYSCFKDVKSILRQFGDRLDWGTNKMEETKDQKDDFIKQSVSLGISGNSNIEWTEYMLGEFQNQINWKVLSQFGHINMSPSILKKFFQYFDKDALLYNSFSVRENDCFDRLISSEMNINMEVITMGNWCWN